jgi:hypothetical protein
VMIASRQTSPSRARNARVGRRSASRTDRNRMYASRSRGFRYGRVREDPPLWTSLWITACARHFRSRCQAAQSASNETLDG